MTQEASMATATAIYPVYDVGDGVELVATLLNVAGQLVDPPTVRCRVRDPGGTVTTYTYGVDMALIRDGPGTYRLRIAVQQPGYWWYRWETADEYGPLGAKEGVIEVARSRFQ
jgi:hypothetical protein